ncbi:nitrogen fixation protein FixH [Cohaesibacter celericrescens]|uniref:Nitrogen fixation protein FixH n=2 Tax=Cohaesibacter celericrescens TaxID=2067669 RepID=A0A2N5XK52_9HYPH|nr:nitrogen fixation protein FixH [Cohaesibacter celericrescens]
MGTAMNKKEKKFTGKHVLIWLGCFFGVMFFANGMFVYFARSTWPGVVEQSPYQASQNYNKTLAEAEAQNERSWHMEVELKRSQSGVYLELLAKDKLNNPLNDLSITANVGRPTTETQDQELSLEAAGDGLYRAKVAALNPGNWRIKIEASQKGEVMFQTLETITLK